MTAVPRLTRGDPPAGEWRHGWWVHRSWGCDWREVFLRVPLPDLHLKWGKAYGIYWAFGPVYAWLTVKKGAEWFENGKRTGTGVGPV